MKTFLIGICRIENHQKTRVRVHFANAEWTLFVWVHFGVPMRLHRNNSPAASSNIMSKIMKLIFKLNSLVLWAIWHFAETNTSTFFTGGRRGWGFRCTGWNRVIENCVAVNAYQEQLSRSSYWRTGWAACSVFVWNPTPNGRINYELQTNVIFFFFCWYLFIWNWCQSVTNW